MEDTLLFLIGNAITTFPSIGYSIWWQTRFVKRIPAILHGLVSLGSGVLLFANLGATEMGVGALLIFLSLGVIYFISCAKLKIWGKHWISLPFSHKTIGGFQIAFFYQLFLIPYLGDLPVISTSVAVNILVWGGIIVLILYALSGLALLIKNRKK